MIVLLCFISYNENFKIPGFGLTVRLCLTLYYFLMFSVSNIKRSLWPRVRMCSHTTSCTRAATTQLLVVPRYTVVRTGLPSKLMSLLIANCNKLWLHLIATLQVVFSLSGVFISVQISKTRYLDNKNMVQYCQNLQVASQLSFKKQ